MHLRRITGEKKGKMKNSIKKEARANGRKRRGTSGGRKEKIKRKWRSRGSSRRRGGGEAR